MAKYDITHTCGHTETVALFGPHADRERRIARMEAEDCAACRAAGSDLTGSVKQIAWATDIRAEMAPKIAAAHDELIAQMTARPLNPNLADGEAKLATVIAAVTARRDVLLGRRAARDWIDDRTNNGKADLYETMKSAMREVLK